MEDVGDRPCKSVNNGETWVLDSSVDSKGKVPLRAKTGVWKAALFIIGIEFSERLSFFGLSTNLIIYLTRVLHQEVKTAAKSVNYWMGVTAMSPLLGGFIADSYLGRFNTVFASCLLYLLGLSLLTMSQYIPHLKPLSEGGAFRRHEAVFFAAMYIISIATGGHKPALESFGADQFDSDHCEERKKKMSYFNWWNAGLCSGLIFGVTFIVYLQDSIGWGVSYIVLTVIMAVGLIVFCSGRTFYRYRLPGGSTLTPLVQVAFAAFAKRNLPLPTNPAELYEKSNVHEGPHKRLLAHTSSLRFLDRAAIIENKDDAAVEMCNPWRLATVTQVEEVKLIMNMIPIWLTTQTFGLCVAQASTFFIKQGSIMDRKFGSFEIPPASIYSLAAIGMIVSVTIYDKLLIPYIRRRTGDERGIGILQRIGYGMVFSILAMSTAALVEKKRLRSALEQKELMSVLWLAPQFIILGFGDGFTLVGLQEYFYEQVPDAMRSIGIAFYLSVIGVSNFLSSLLITVVDKVTGRIGGSWFARDLNMSRLDFFYWLLAVLNVTNLCAYTIVVRKYTRTSVQKKRVMATAAVDP